MLFIQLFQHQAKWGILVDIEEDVHVAVVVGKVISFLLIKIS